MLNAMTVDVEEHFQVTSFSRIVDRSSWDSMPSRVEANTSRLLAAFEEAGVRATFFVLGWVARRQERLLRRIADAGHELACHGLDHTLVYRQRAEEFRADTLAARDAIEQASGKPVRGYRAASFSITRESLWALDVLAECGFEYDSSVFPGHHDRYGVPGAPRRIHRLVTSSGTSIVEVPPSTVRIAGLVLGVAGGGYLRHFPGATTRWAIRRLNGGEGLPAVVYVHPWEVDPDPPRVSAPWATRLRHYGRLSSTLPKLRRLMRGFRFGPLRDVIAAAGADLPTLSAPPSSGVET
jgi:polysaccharide deacetylase family protein (PEP-CTERM system associated)